MHVMLNLTGHLGIGKTIHNKSRLGDHATLMLLLPRRKIRIVSAFCWAITPQDSLLSTPLRTLVPVRTAAPSRPRCSKRAPHFPRCERSGGDGRTSGDRAHPGGALKRIGFATVKIACALYSQTTSAPSPSSCFSFDTTVSRSTTACATIIRSNGSR